MWSPTGNDSVAWFQDRHEHPPIGTTPQLGPQADDFVERKWPICSTSASDAGVHQREPCVERQSKDMTRKATNPMANGLVICFVKIAHTLLATALLTGVSLGAQDRPPAGSTDWLIVPVTTASRVEARADGTELVLDNGLLRRTFRTAPNFATVGFKHLGHGERFDMMETTFYLSRETIVPSMARGMLPVRARLFAVMSKNATSASDFFHIPTNRVVELGTQLVI